MTSATFFFSSMGVDDATISTPVELWTAIRASMLHIRMLQRQLAELDCEKSGLDAVVRFEERLHSELRAVVSEVLEMFEAGENIGLMDAFETQACTARIVDREAV